MTQPLQPAPIMMAAPILPRVRMERTVTLGLMLTVILQTAGALIWVGGAEARLAELERETDGRWDISERLARLEGETAIMRQSLRRIETAVHDEN